MVAREALKRFIREEAYKPMTAAELAEVFGLKSEQDRKDFKHVLDVLEADGEVVKNSEGRYGVPERLNLVVGKLQGHPKGFAFVLPDYEAFDDLFVHPEDLNGAVHGDRVVAQPTSTSDEGKNWEGEIVRILSRANDRIVGTLDHYKDYGFVIPDDRRIFQDIFVAGPHLNGVKDGEKVVVHVTKWPDQKESRKPEGRIIQRLGKVDEPGVDTRSIIYQYGFSESFPPEVEEQARGVPDTVLSHDIRGRTDLREMTTFTIDGEDARDFDDAVSIQELSGEEAAWRLAVHIADVSHYVTEDSPLDVEARERATSVYLVDRVVPMLPPDLSNGICSLNPEVDRLTLTVLMDFDQDGQLVDHELKQSVIHSDARLTYRKVQSILDGDTEMRQRYASIVPDLEAMAKLARKRRERRFDNGSIDFDLPEAKVILDDQGHPLDVVPAQRLEAHRLIEEFMLACNQTVAEHFYWLTMPFLYRIHEEPKPEDIESFRRFLKPLGFHLRKTEQIQPKDLQQILEAVKGRDEEYLISSVMLRSLQRARYAVECKGHFGLAFRYYTHFTSPIRRYPDLIVHRIVKEVLDAGSLSAKRTGTLINQLPKIAQHSSEQERQAEYAERESVDNKKVEYMERRLGDEFEGIISGVTPFGCFVALKNTVEGLVHVREMSDDYYQYEEDRYALIGERTGRSYRLGDRVRVQVLRVDQRDHQIDFRMVDDHDEDDA